MLSDREQKVLKETRLRNLKRKQAKIMQHSELLSEQLKLQNEINALENELNS